MKCSHRFWVTLAGVLLVFHGGEAGLLFGQITIQGVRIDAEGVMRSRQIVHNLPAKPNAKVNAEQVVISLPKLFEEVRRLHEAGQQLPERIRYLDGLVKIERIQVLPEKSDLILMGSAETWDLSDPSRPRGRRTGRPVISLDDLVFALRQFGPQSRSRVFGCTLEQDNAAVGRVAQLQREILVRRIADQTQIARALKQALGPLTAKYFGVPTDSRYALVSVEADYLMKRLSLGLDPLPVPRMKSYLDYSGHGHAFNRFWFVADYPPLLVTEDGLMIQIPARGLGLRTSDSAQSDDSKNPGAEKFAKDFSRHISKLESAVPAFADLHNLTDLAVAASLIAEDKLAAQAKWDMRWVLDPAHYLVPKVATPKQAESLVNVRRERGKGVTVAGGARLDVPAILKSRRPFQNTSASAPLVSSGWSKRVPASRD